MTDKHSVASSGDVVHPIVPARQRFSIISLFTSNRNSKKSKKQKPQKKGKDIDFSSTSVFSSRSGVGNERPVKSVSELTNVRISSNGETTRECLLCCEERSITEFPDLLIGCPHRSCATCLEQYVKIEISESRVDIPCPECTERIHPVDIQKILNNGALMSKYEEFMLRRVLVSDPDTRWCPAPDCSYAVLAHGCAGCPMLRCERPGCNTLFCYHCKQEWHANQTCEMARLERIPILSLSLSESSSSHTIEEYKPCPRCKTIINKMDDGSCNHMTCTVCHAQFCWLCLKEASDLHYLSPSGCTFWGKKPWSRKKKILWQLGTLIGAPVGIALIAGLSVPLFVIGLPIVAGRKLFRKFKLSNKHKRNAIVTFGSIGAFLISPAVAALTIAIGVPILLAYVYGVVPISLCRGSTCGVLEDNGALSSDINGSNPENSGLGLGRKENSDPSTIVVINPSIGPSIGEASIMAGGYHGLSASGIQMDRVGLSDDQSDRQSSSNRNVAGTSVIGSIYDQEILAQKLEVHADVTQESKRKNSVESVHTLGNVDNRSLGPDNRSLRSDGIDNRSHVSFNVDNASIKALAGSISAARDHDGVSVITTTEFTADVRNKSCMRNDHGSPVSNRSVKFAHCDELTSTRSKSKKPMKLRDISKENEKSDSRSFDTVSCASGEFLPTVKKCSDFRQRSHIDDKEKTLDEMCHGLTQVDTDGRRSCSANTNKRYSSEYLSIQQELPVLTNIIEDK